MATLDYVRRMANLENRRFDRELKESTFSKSASAAFIPAGLKYLLESTRPIGDKHNQKSLEAAEKVVKHLEGSLDLHFSRAYRTQGSVRTNTNIKVHSDFDLLVAIDRYFYPEKPNGNNYTASDPNIDIRSLRKEVTSIMKDTYDEVNDEGTKGIYIYNKNLGRKVDIVFCFWYHSVKYQETHDEFYKGIHLYDFHNNKRLDKDFPFAMIQNVNHKGESTNDGSRRGIRLLKTLRADATEDLSHLKSFQLTSIVHGIPNEKIFYQPGAEVRLAESVSQELDKLISDPSYRKARLCPKGIEHPLDNDKVVPDLQVIKDDLDILIGDTKGELIKSTFLTEAVKNY